MGGAAGKRRKLSKQVCEFAILNILYVNIMVIFGNPGKKRKLSRKRKVRKKIKGRVGKKGEILQR